MITQGKTVDDWSNGKRNWLDHYAFLSAVLPASEEVYVPSIQISAQGVIRLAGKAVLRVVG